MSALIVQNNEQGLGARRVWTVAQILALLYLVIMAWSELLEFSKLQFP